MKEILLRSTIVVAVLVIFTVCEILATVFEWSALVLGLIGIVSLLIVRLALGWERSLKRRGG